MPLPFLPGHDATAVPARGDLLIAATVDGQIMVLSDGGLPCSTARARCVAWFARTHPRVSGTRGRRSSDENHTPPYSYYLPYFA
ncbi:hypothetical protein [Rhizomonospora bruguierae]|uniref:hypothetical protein n=1 Tax=Rhizomonospora bruguierae TaxID=1581705 RepID=UPI001BCA6E40|nr:hypothetical protein [Micromonospora sp. NBRC 107566]